ncbi:hypothetical protein HDU85_004124 [Gaertneriomyces sp. JEL0708]|nr:hypothetical protein HDU85_004124 [Gaertneriomyces sp. JEL0708]
MDIPNSTASSIPLQACIILPRIEEQLQATLSTMAREERVHSQYERRNGETWMWVRGSAEQIESLVKQLEEWSLRTPWNLAYFFQVSPSSGPSGGVLRHGSSGGFAKAGAVDRAFEGPPPPYTPSSPSRWECVRGIARKIYDWVPLKKVTTLVVGLTAVGANVQELTTKISPGIGLTGAVVVNTASTIAAAVRPPSATQPAFDEAATLAKWRYHQLVEQARKDREATAVAAAHIEELRAQQMRLPLDMERVKEAGVTQRERMREETQRVRVETAARIRRKPLA